MTAVMPEVDRVGYEIHGWVPAGFLTADDIDSIDLDVPFEIQDGDLLIMAPPSAWHDATSDDVRGYLKRRHAWAAEDMVVVVGDNIWRPDVVAVAVSREELLRSRARKLYPAAIEVAVEIISHDGDPAKDKLSVNRDRELKFREYALAGIPEYWIIDETADDPLDASVEIYRLRSGSYVPVRVVRLSQLLTEKP
ncbi:MAG: Uma2 family endonuclease [Hamadaea sp.]|uniref:Uma2 family endonuclease n=1 Tax=Hamadaea sp. TaxID=2024425 RepID=UPI0017B9A165|nr:Uma2 family endonuclease [Hamadaea sp.]NUT18073.1 Uma2 family endonuclease [Hamadaea sp.]